MRRRWIVGLVAFVVLGCGSTSRQPSGPVVAEAPGPFLWQVEGPKGPGPNGPSYLFGTMHLGIEPDRDLAPVVWERFRASTVFAMETDIQDMRAKREELVALALLPEGEALDQKLTPAQWKVLVEMLAPVPPEALRKFRPWFAVIALTQRFAAQTPSMDLVMLERARAAKKPIAFFETWREQVDIVDRALTLELLAEELNDIERVRRQNEALAAAYKSGSSEKLVAMVFDRASWGPDTPRALEIAVFARNRRWLPEVEKLVAQGGAFIAVGAGHLVGDKSVIALLRARGHRVTRIPAAPSPPPPRHSATSAAMPGSSRP